MLQTLSRRRGRRRPCSSPRRRYHFSWRGVGGAAACRQLHPRHHSSACGSQEGQKSLRQQLSPAKLGARAAPLQLGCPSLAGRMRGTLCHSLPVLLGLLLCHPTTASGPCWENSKCQDLASEAGVLACAKACRAELSAEAPVYPGNGHLQPLSESIRKYVMSHFRWNKFGRRNSSSSGGHKREEVAGVALPVTSPHRPGGEEEDGEGLQREEGKRSYSMEHFRWGKPVGRKRRPIKVYPNSVDEESAESYPMEFRREMAPDRDPLGLSEEEEEGEGEEEKKDGGSYRMRHFRWHAPLKDKRYGGFMSLEHSQTPLMTLFKNAIVKSAYKKGQ